MQRHFETGEALCEEVARNSEVAILAFSCGKDSIGSWLQMKRYFKKIVPYYLYLVPDLEFVEKSIRYYEKFFETKILQYPHPSLYRMLKNLVFQAPENCWITELHDLRVHDYQDIRRWVIRDADLPPDTFVASGVRQNDSMMRRASIKKHGPISENTRTFFPIFDWNDARLVQELNAAKVKLPIDYRMFGRTFDGIDYRFLKPISDYFPDDYARILEFFPLAELEIERRRWRSKHGLR